MYKLKVIRLCSLDAYRLKSVITVSNRRLSSYGNIESTLLFLRQELKRANEDYYAGKPTKSDQEYDTLFKKLSDLEKANPHLSSTDSPTRSVGSVASETSLQHRLRMLSLNSISSFEEFSRFYSSVASRCCN